MKESFEQALHAVNEAVKDAPSEKAGIKQAGESLKKEGLAEVIPMASRVDVFELQKEKHEIMDWLHDSLDKIDHNEGVESFSYNTEPYVVNENMEVFLDEQKENVTLGDIATDGDWGVEYKLLPDVPRNIKKKYVVAEAKRHISKLLDRQIAAAELEREVPTRSNMGAKLHAIRIKESYEAILRREEGDLPGGVIAEKMLKTYFEKFEINNDAPFTFEMADISDDVERKIDFYLHKHTSTLGIGAGEPTERENVGIQFTTDTSNETHEKKLAQIRHSKKEFGLRDIDDIVLVTLPLNQTKYLYHKWVEEGKKPGGPAKLWKRDTEETVFRGVLQGFFSDAQINEMWGKRAQ